MTSAAHLLQWKAIHCDRCPATFVRESHHLGLLYTEARQEGWLIEHSNDPRDRLKRICICERCRNPFRLNFSPEGWSLTQRFPVGSYPTRRWEDRVILNTSAVTITPTNVSIH